MTASSSRSWDFFSYAVSLLFPSGCAAMPFADAGAVYLIKRERERERVGEGEGERERRKKSQQRHHFVISIRFLTFAH